jgi:hypothetical protein
VQATDNRGATFTSAPISISVTSSATLPVTLQDPRWFGGNFFFSFASQPDHTYEVQYVDALASTGWQVSTTLNGNGGTLTVSNPSTPFIRFYRVQTK